MKRGRQSGAEHAMIGVVVLDVTRRMPPPPPPELDPEQSAIWKDLAGSMPGNWLRSPAHGLLVELCRRICRSRRLEQEIRNFQQEWLCAVGGVERFGKLLAAGDRESKAILALSRALRLTPQSQMHARDAGRRLAELGPDDRAPWDALPVRRRRQVRNGTGESAPHGGEVKSG
jgi:hypothetical protein